jgi:phosphomannomutase
LVEWDAVGVLHTGKDPIDPYLDAIAAVFDLPKLRDLRVVVIAATVPHPLILSRMNERFGFNFILINERPDGAISLTIR